MVIKDILNVSISLKLVSFWKWKIDNYEVCGICQNEFEEACPACEVPNESCIPGIFISCTKVILFYRKRCL